MQVELKTPMADALGRSYRPGGRYEMADEEAERLIGAGFASAVPSDAGMVVDLLAKLGGGLVVTKTTDLGLVAAAKKRRLVIKRVRGVPEEAADGGDGS